MASNIAIIFIAWQVVTSFAGPEQCERSKCRIARNVIMKDLLPHYQELRAKIPYQCPFFKDRDKYIANEEHKDKESSSRWSCGYCGKAFIGEIYLDDHYTNRHPETAYKEADSVCLADYCELFRCDVLSGIAKPSFWDVALCMEEDMQDLAADCQELMEQCIPQTLSWNASKALKNKLSKSVCSFLTCKKFFEAPESVQEEEPVGMPYLVMTIFLAIGFILYYCVAVNYFWFDTFSDMYYEDSDDNKYRTRGAGSLFADETQELEKRVLNRSKKRSLFIQSEGGGSDLFNMKKGVKSSLEKSVKEATKSGKSSKEGSKSKR